ncbi:hypothetical protein CJ030_MR0G003717 [Morella rubra]|uniref:Uncharacterized protein n=1 Tax=Morella rubra TaxID=262757 RepID=A0A6A1UNT1_9ROSI|nr:hypothetical protein CJ030_MR0G003717 [Morella rubra]
MMAFNGLLTVRTVVKQLPSSIGLFKDRQLVVSMSECERPSSESWLSRFSSWMSKALLQASSPGFCSLGSLVLNNCNLAEDGAGPCYLRNIVPGSEIPNWFSCQKIGSLLSFHVPSLSGHKNGIFVICAVVAFKKELQEEWTEFRLVFHNKTRSYRRDLLITAGYDLVADEIDHLVLMKGLVKGNEVVLLGALEGFVGLKMISGEEIEMSFEVSGSE